MKCVTLKKAFLCASLLLLAGAMSPGTRSADGPTTSITPAMESVASLRPEVRLRKLHLVRPDLILYPLSYEIYC